MNKWKKKKITKVQRIRKKRILRYCQVITTSQSFNLISIPEWSTHHNGLVSKLLVIVINPRYTLHAGVFLWSKCLLSSVFHKRRDQVYICLSTRYSLSEKKKFGCRLLVLIFDAEINIRMLELLHSVLIVLKNLKTFCFSS